MTEQMNYEQTIEALTKIAESKPEDYTYQGEFGDETGCTYAVVDIEAGETPEITSTMTQPACIVGHLFHEMGFLDKLSYCNGNSLVYMLNRDTFIGSVPNAAEVRAMLHERFNDDAQRALTRIQFRQDYGWAWCEAVAKDTPSDEWV